MSKPYAEFTRRAVTGALLLAAFALAGCSTPAVRETPTSPSSPATTQPVAPPPVSDATRDSYGRALAAMKKEDWTTAQTLLQALSNSNPDLPGPAVNLGIVYAHLNRTADARKMLESASARWPGFAPGQHQLGKLLSAQGEFEAADAAYARAEAADPNYALAYYDRAVLNELYLQRPQVALQNYEQFQHLLPIADEQVAHWIEDLRRRAGVKPPADKPASAGGAHS